MTSFGSVNATEELQKFRTRTRSQKKRRTEIEGFFLGFSRASLFVNISLPGKQPGKNKKKSKSM
jgi:hypothetical protein